MGFQSDFSDRSFCGSQGLEAVQICPRWSHWTERQLRGTEDPPEDPGGLAWHGPREQPQWASMPI